MGFELCSSLNLTVFRMTGSSGGGVAGPELSSEEDTCPSPGTLGIMSGELDCGGGVGVTRMGYWSMAPLK